MGGCCGVHCFTGKIIFQLHTHKLSISQGKKGRKMLRSVTLVGHMSGVCGLATSSFIAERNMRRKSFVPSSPTVAADSRPAYVCLHVSEVLIVMDGLELCACE